MRDGLTEASIWWDNSHAMTPECFDRLRADMIAYAERHGFVRARPPCRRRAEAQAQGARLHGIRLAFPVHSQFADSSVKGGDRRFRPGAYDSRLAVVSGRAGTARVPYADRDRRRFQPKDRADRRHELRRRNQEGGVRLSQFPSSAQARLADALRGQCRWRRRERAVFRTLRHGQNNVVGGCVPLV